MENLVEVKNLKKKYGSKEAVKGISFNIQKRNLRTFGTKWIWKNYNNWNDAWIIKTY